MSIYPDDFRYTKDHEWADVDGHHARIGITHHAQEKLGDIVFVELPEVGEVYKTNDTFGTVESVKAVSEIYCPVAGEVIEVNEKLENEPELVNDDPHCKGWMIVISMSDPTDVDHLMTAVEYETYLKVEAAAPDDDGFDDDYKEDSEYEDDDGDDGDDFKDK